jgi:serine/threonine protein kinase
LLDRVAQGRLSTLYRAKLVRTGETVALKLLSEYGCRVANKLSRKLKKDWEGARALKLSHPNVVRTIACGRERGRYYIVMEFLSGGNLSGLLRSDSPAVQGKKIEIMRQAARALEYVHEQGTIHRDVCPRNVMLDADGDAKLIDFGVAATKGDRVRNVGTPAGRPGYMAPERVRHNRFNERTDIYAFGVSLYEVATGQRPFRVSEETYRALASMLNIGFPPPRKVRPSISPRLEAIILRAMATRPDARYPSMTVLLEHLADVTDDDL